MCTISARVPKQFLDGAFIPSEPDCYVYRVLKSHKQQTWIGVLIEYGRKNVYVQKLNCQQN